MKSLPWTRRCWVDEQLCPQKYGTYCPLVDWGPEMSQSMPTTALNKGWWSCPHCTQDGEPKRTYRSRSQARKIRRLMQDSKAVAAYKCPYQDGWHLGHLPKITRRGDLTRGEVYSQRDDAA